MFAPAYMSRKRGVSNAVPVGRDACRFIEQRQRWASPIFFGPRTLRRTWGTRPITQVFLRIRSCAQSASFSSQCFHRIDSGCPARWNPGGEESQQQHHRWHRNEGQRIEHADLEQEAAQELHQQSGHQQSSD
jgi:hypothetical protein